MNHLNYLFKIFDFFTGIGRRLESWRIQQKSRMEFNSIDAHTLQDLGIINSANFAELGRSISD